MILISGVVNRAVAERAFAVKADELLRKPFQPQDLITRIQRLLDQDAPPEPGSAAAGTLAALAEIFATPLPVEPELPKAATLPNAKPHPAQPPAPEPPRAFTAPVSKPSPTPCVPPPAPAAARNSTGLSLQKIEIMNLQALIRKLRLELEAEREYSRALEASFKMLQEGS